MIALYHYHHDIDANGVVYSFEELHKATFSPFPHDILILDGAHGKTYQERKASIQDQAIEYSYLQGNVVMYQSDALYIGDYFEHYGRRYGLTEEFRENGII